MCSRIHKRVCVCVHLLAHTLMTFVLKRFTITCPPLELLTVLGTYSYSFSQCGLKIALSKRTVDLA